MTIESILSRGSNRGYL